MVLKSSRYDYYPHAVVTWMQMFRGGGCAIRIPKQEVPSDGLDRLKKGVLARILVRLLSPSLYPSLLLF